MWQTARHIRSAVQPRQRAGCRKAIPAEATLCRNEDLVQHGAQLSHVLGIVLHPIAEQLNLRARAHRGERNVRDHPRIAFYHQPEICVSVGHVAKV
jgi:hypothetical protein